MTTEVLSAAVRTGHGSVIPLGSRAAVLADLRRRLANAEQIARDAEAAGDERRFRRAVERVWLRTFQISHIEAYPADAICPRCTWGDERWPAGPLIDRSTVLISCLEHMQDVHETKAAALAAREEV
jgi:hypothetical protein